MTSIDKVEIPVNELREYLIFAFRYALGRKTYAASIMVGNLKAHWGLLNEGTRKQIQDDIRHAIVNDMAGYQCDVERWETLL